MWRDSGRQHYEDWRSKISLRLLHLHQLLGQFERWLSLEGRTGEWNLLPVLSWQVSWLIAQLPLYHCLTARLFALKCAKCQLPIVPDQNETSVQRLRALNKDFHPDCFCCDVSFIIILERENNVNISRPVASYSRKDAFRSAINRSATIAMRTEEESNF